MEVAMKYVLPIMGVELVQVQYLCQRYINLYWRRSKRIFIFAAFPILTIAKTLFQYLWVALLNKLGDKKPVINWKW